MNINLSLEEQKTNLEAGDIIVFGCSSNPSFGYIVKEHICNTNYVYKYRFLNLFSNMLQKKTFDSPEEIFKWIKRDWKNTKIIKADKIQLSELE